MSGVMYLLIIVALVLFGAVVALLFRMFSNRGRSTEPCQNCGSTNLVEIGRQTLGTNTVEQQGGGFGGGGDIRLQTEEEITYRCNDCQQSSTARIRKTH